jgi:hypothetical protein
MIRRELMMIEIIAQRSMLAPHIDNRDRGIGKISLRRFAPHDGHPVHSSQQTAGKQFVLMGATGMSQDKCERQDGDFQKR